MMPEITGRIAKGIRLSANAGDQVVRNHMQD